MINNICRNLSEKEVFLNIGAYRGFSTVCGMINTSCEVHSVDNFSEFEGPETIFYENFNKFKNENIFYIKKITKFFLKAGIKKLIFTFMMPTILMNNNIKILKLQKIFLQRIVLFILMITMKNQLLRELKIL